MHIQICVSMCITLGMYVHLVNFKCYFLLKLYVMVMPCCSCVNLMWFSHAIAYFNWNCISFPGLPTVQVLQFLHSTSNQKLDSGKTQE